MDKCKKSNYRVKKTSRKTYDLQLDPELHATWATDQELPEGQFKQCWPHGKYTHPTGGRVAFTRASGEK